ncbi:polyprenyl synthetase family protein, partial [Streptomyces sp. SID2999]|nr:polyprenyl synthetase family protein [Streptomyces sp. SID2999]
GGRAAALAEARAHLAAARTLLDGLPLEPGAAAELGALLDALTDRER